MNAKYLGWIVAGVIGYVLYRQLAGNHGTTILPSGQRLDY